MDEIPRDAPRKISKFFGRKPLKKFFRNLKISEKLEKFSYKTHQEKSLKKVWENSPKGSSERISWKTLVKYM